MDRAIDGNGVVVGMQSTGSARWMQRDMEEQLRKWREEEPGVAFQEAVRSQHCNRAV